MLNEYSQSWWSPRVAKAIEEYKQIKRDNQTSELRRVQVRSHQNREIKLVKAASFQGLMHSTEFKTKLMWKLAKWGRSKEYKPPQSETISPLHKEGHSLASTFEAKIEALREWFFPEPAEVDLSDIISMAHLPKVECALSISEDQMAVLIVQLSVNKASEASGILNEFLKMLEASFVKAMTELTLAC